MGRFYFPAPLNFTCLYGQAEKRVAAEILQEPVLACLQIVAVLDFA